MSVVIIQNLSHRYPDGTQALNGVSLTIHPNEKVALLGPNGSGKSTLLLHLNGILQPTTGSVTVSGESHLRHIRTQVGLVFQNPDDQLFSLQVYQDVAFGPRNMGLAENVVAERVKAALEAVGLAELSQRNSYHLSIGQKKRVALATVLSMNPPLLVLDEPSAGLDPRARRQLLRLLQGMNDHTMIVSTHDIRFAYALCSRAVVLDEGQVAADGVCADVVTNGDLMHRHGLETPFDV